MDAFKPYATNALFALLGSLITFGAASRSYAQSNDSVPATFFIFYGDYLVRFQFNTDDGSTTVERNSGKCVQKITVPNAAIAVFQLPDFQLVAEGEGTFNVDATIDCRTGQYTFERTIATSAGTLFDALTGDRLRFKLRAVVINSELKVFDMELVPKGR